LADLASRYNRQGDTILIEVHLDQAAQLFESLDPTPFHHRDLNADAEEYIVSATREFNLTTPLRLVLHLGSGPDTETGAATLQEAIHHYFDYRALVADRELRLKLREGRISLIIGLVFLFFCMSLTGILGTLSSPTWAKFAEEGLLIIGWVALWRPVEIFLYEWWMLYEKRAVLRKLRMIPVEVRTEITS
jgi:hypothetical protein